MVSMLNEHGEFEDSYEPKHMKLSWKEPEKKPKLAYRRTCPVCQLNFWAYTRSERFCSDRCGKVWAEMEKSRKRGRVCPICGRPVIGNRKRVYCSSSCKQKANGKKGAKDAAE